ncbi:MAG: competence/damage-inducible protein A [Rhodospirillales bacterium]|nr:competence/damage-inducible protein A [Rhodospirillales bacterium]
MPEISEDNPDNAPVTAAMVIIGNEILSGRTQDANLSYAATRLNDFGIQMREVRVIPDVEDTIVETVNELRQKYHYVFTTGGIGPTHDDITADSIAKAFGVPLEINPMARALLEEHYGAKDLTEARLRMARVPKGGVLIDNPLSRAPGFQIENVLVMAGVPVVMRSMIDSVAPRLIGGKPVLSRSVMALVRESDIADGLSALQDKYSTVEIGSYPFFRKNKVGANLVMRGTDTDVLDQVVIDLKVLVRELGAEPVEDRPPE